MMIYLKRGREYKADGMDLQEINEKGKARIKEVSLLLEE